MKRITFLLFITLLVGFSPSLQAQSSAIDRYYESYRQDDRFTLVTVSSKMFSLFVNFELDDPAEQEIVKTISKLKGLKMLIGNEITDAKTMFRKVVGKPEADMDELMSVTEAGKEFRFYITEANGKISELLMIGYEDQQVLMLSLVGEIDLKEIAALSKKMDIKGFEHFENVGK